MILERLMIAVLLVLALLLAVLTGAVLAIYTAAEIMEAAQRKGEHL